MKKSIVALAIILITGLTSAFANSSEDITKGILASFSNDFSNAQNASWQTGKEYAKVTFTLNGQVFFAYYSNENNQLMAVVRNILSDKLPINLSADLKKNYPGYWITGLFEMAKHDHTTYYATLESGSEEVVLKSADLNEWEMFRRTKK